MKKIIDSGQTNGQAWTDKNTVHSYFPIYEEEFDKISDINLLEIGIYMGGSMRVWDEHFEGKSMIVGIDNFAYTGYQVPDDLWVNKDRVFMGDSTRIDGWDENINKMEFDYIIDDGDHSFMAQINTFDIFFKYVKKGGKYFIEDVDSNSSLENIKNHLNIHGYKYKVYDVRLNKNRYDDVIVVIYK
jgi:hypothetical protein